MRGFSLDYRAGRQVTTSCSPGLFAGRVPSAWHPGCSSPSASPSGGCEARCRVRCGGQEKRGSARRRHQLPRRLADVLAACARGRASALVDTSGCHARRFPRFGRGRVAVTWACESVRSIRHDVRTLGVVRSFARRFGGGFTDAGSARSSALRVFLGLAPSGWIPPTVAAAPRTSTCRTGQPDTPPDAAGCPRWSGSRLVFRADFSSSEGRRPALPFAEISLALSACEPQRAWWGASVLVPFPARFAWFGDVLLRFFARASV